MSIKNIIKNYYKKIKNHRQNKKGGKNNLKWEKRLKFK